MDEIDAALDFRNVSVIAEYIKERTKDSQFIIISLRNQMFELANELIGIYKTFDITKVVVFNPNSYDVRGRPVVIEKKKVIQTETKEEVKENNMEVEDENKEDKKEEEVEEEKKEEEKKEEKEEEKKEENEENKEKEKADVNVENKSD